MLPGQFEVVVAKLSIPAHYLSGSTAPQAMRAVEVVRHIEGQGRIEEALQIVRALAGARPVAEAGSLGSPPLAAVALGKRRADALLPALRTAVAFGAPASAEEPEAAAPAPADGAGAPPDERRCGARRATSAPGAKGSHRDALKLVQRPASGDCTGRRGDEGIFHGLDSPPPRLPVNSRRVGPQRRLSSTLSRPAPPPPTATLATASPPRAPRAPS